MKTSRNKRSKLILVLGGAASGKSQVSLDLAGQAGPRVFVATGEALDQEMALRIARHRATRSSDWVTAEVPTNLVEWFEANKANYQTVVLDCLTLWLNNLQDRRLSTSAISDATIDLLHAIRATRARVVIVSNELGLGLVPVTKVVRAFRDL